MFSIGSRNEASRDLWVRKTLKKIGKGKTILDAGAGEQQYKKYCTHLKYVSQDFAEYVPKNLDRGLQMRAWDYGKLDIISDISAIPVEKSSFDVVLCTEVFEHIIDPQLALNEFSRVLKRGGKLIITAPFASFTHFAPYHYATGFSKFYYELLLPKYGFKIISIDHNGNYFHFVAQELRRLPFMIDKYVTNKILSFPLKLLSFALGLLFIVLLEIANSYSKKSDEFSVFGYHIIAKKVK